MRTANYNHMIVDLVIEQHGDGLTVEVWNHNICVARVEVLHEHDLLNLQDEVSRALDVAKGVVKRMGELTEDEALAYGDSQGPAPYTKKAQEG